MGYYFDEIKRALEKVKAAPSSMPHGHGITMNELPFAIQDLWSSRFIDPRIKNKVMQSPVYVYAADKFIVYSFGHLKFVTWIHIAQSISLLDALYGERATYPISICLAYSPRKKMLPHDRNVVLNATHVNSGLSMIRSMACLIYRVEEMHKVILHELIHLYSNNESITNEQDELIQARLSLQVLHGYTIRLNEARTDTLACLFLCALRIGGAAFTKDRYMHQVRRLKRHAYMVAGNIIMFYKDRQWIEDTHVFSYYIGKALALAGMLAKNRGWTWGSDFFEFINPLCKHENLAKLTRFANMSNMSLRMCPKVT